MLTRSRQFVPETLTPEQRLAETAAILARGIHRLLATRPILTSAESKQIPLELSSESRLSVPKLTRSESAEGVE